MPGMSALSLEVLLAGVLQTVLQKHRMVRVASVLSSAYFANSHEPELCVHCNSPAVLNVILGAESNFLRLNFHFRKTIFSDWKVCGLKFSWVWLPLMTHCAGVRERGPEQAADWSRG